MMQPDWHSADIIAALKKQGRRCPPFPANQGWRPPRWQMR
jgi:lambda repressor-like predicted transcriptional regulator